MTIWRDVVLAHALGSINEIEPACPAETQASSFDPNLALAVLARHRTNRDGGERGGRRRPRPSEEEVNARLTRQLDALARQLRKRV